MQVKLNGNWTNAKEVKVKHNNEWKDADTWVKVDGEWKKLFPPSYIYNFELTVSTTGGVNSYERDINESSCWSEWVTYYSTWIKLTMSLRLVSIIDQMTGQSVSTSLPKTVQLTRLGIPGEIVYPANTPIGTLINGDDRRIESSESTSFPPPSGPPTGYVPDFAITVSNSSDDCIQFVIPAQGYIFRNHTFNKNSTDTSTTIVVSILDK